MQRSLSCPLRLSFAIPPESGKGPNFQELQKSCVTGNPATVLLLFILVNGSYRMNRISPSNLSNFQLFPARRFHSLAAVLMLACTMIPGWMTTLQAGRITGLEGYYPDQESPRGWAVAWTEDNKADQVAVEEIARMGFPEDKDGSTYFDWKGETVYCVVVLADKIGSQDILDFGIGFSPNSYAEAEEKAWRHLGTYRWLWVRSRDGYRVAEQFIISSGSGSRGASESGAVSTQPGTGGGGGAGGTTVQRYVRVNPSEVGYPANGGIGNISVEANTSWTVSAPFWIDILSGASGWGNGSIRYQVNPTGQARAGDIAVGPASVRINQSNPVISLTPAVSDYPYTASSGTVAVNSNVNWSAKAKDLWVRLASGSVFGSAGPNGRIDYSVEQSTISRESNISVGDGIHVVRQAGPVTAIQPSEISLGALAQTIEVTVTTQAPFTIENVRGTGTYWVIETGGRKTYPDSRTISLDVLGNFEYFSIVGNEGSTTRVGKVNIGGQILTITQAPDDTRLNTDRLLNVPANGAAYPVTVTSSYDWQVDTYGGFDEFPDWLSFSPASGTGNGELQITIASNPSYQERSFWIYVNGQRIVVQQVGQELDWAGSRTLVLSDAGGSASRNLNSTMAWTMQDTPDWFHINSPTSGGSGPFVLDYSWDLNPTAQPRIGILKIGDASIRLEQLARAPYIEPKRGIVKVDQLGRDSEFPDAGYGIRIPVTANVSWQMDSLPEWVSLYNYRPEPGNGYLVLRVQANPNALTRTGDVQLLGPKGLTGTFQIQQQPAPIEFQINPKTRQVEGQTAIGSVSWATNPDVPWTLEAHPRIDGSTAPPITFSKGSGLGNASVSYTINQASATFNDQVYVVTPRGLTEPWQVVHLLGNIGDNNTFKNINVSHRTAVVDGDGRVVSGPVSPADPTVLEFAVTADRSWGPFVQEYSNRRNPFIIDILDNPNWVEILPPSTFSGDGTLRLRLKPKTEPYDRAAVISVGARKIGIIQTGVESPTVFIPQEPLWSQAAPVGNGWLSHPWLGFIFPTVDTGGWTYLYSYGWAFIQRPVAGSPDGLWLYLDGLGWIWSTQQSWPYGWSASRQRWLYLQGSRASTLFYFYDFQDEAWFQVNGGLVQPVVNTSNPDADLRPEDFSRTWSAVSGLQGQSRSFSIVLPEAAHSMVVRLSGGVDDPALNDADLYLAFNRPAGNNDYDAFANNSGSFETIIGLEPQPGTWHILVNGFRNFSDLTLDVEVLYDNREIAGAESRYRFSDFSGPADVFQGIFGFISENTSSISLFSSGGTGDLDLLLVEPALVGTSDYTSSSSNSGNEEGISFQDPPTGLWQFLVYGWTAFTGADIEVVVRRKQP